LAVTLIFCNEIPSGPPLNFERPDKKNPGLGHGFTCKYFLSFARNAIKRGTAYNALMIGWFWGKLPDLYFLRV
jgi:hypothetical protein